MSKFTPSCPLTMVATFFLTEMIKCGIDMIQKLKFQRKNALHSEIHFMNSVPIHSIQAVRNGLVLVLC